jgi:hypothetical protein
MHELITVIEIILSLIMSCACLCWTVLNNFIFLSSLSHPWTKCVDAYVCIMALHSIFLQLTQSQQEEQNVSSQSSCTIDLPPRFTISSVLPPITSSQEFVRFSIFSISLLIISSFTSLISFCSLMLFLFLFLLAWPLIISNLIVSSYDMKM